MWIIWKYSILIFSIDFLLNFINNSIYYFYFYHILFLIFRIFHYTLYWLYAYFIIYLINFFILFSLFYHLKNIFAITLLVVLCRILKNLLKITHLKAKLFLVRQNHLLIWILLFDVFNIKILILLTLNFWFLSILRFYYSIFSSRECG